MGNQLIRAGLLGSRRLRRCSFQAHVAYPFVYLIADHWGRFEWDLPVLNSHLFGSRLADVPKGYLPGTDSAACGYLLCLLYEYEQNGLLGRYQCPGVVIGVWSNYQGLPESKRSKSKLPEPEEDSLIPLPDGMQSVPSWYPDGTESERIGSLVVGLGLGEGGGEVKVRGVGAESEQPQKHSALRKSISTALWLFTDAFNRAYGKRIGPPTLTKSADRHFRALLHNYGHKTVACLPLIAWVYDHKQGGDGRCKSRAASHLLRDGERTFLWSSLFERLDQIRQSGGAIKRICEIAEELEILSELNDLGVKYEPDETEIPQGKPEDFAPPKMSTSDMIMKMRREGIPGDS